MTLSERDRTFIEQNPSAAMITLKPDGTPHAVRIGLAVVGGKLWTSGTRDRARTQHIRHDPRCTLFAFDTQFAYLTLETHAKVLDDEHTPEQSLDLFRVMQKQDDPNGTLSWFGGQLAPDELKQTLIDEGRIIYEFDVMRSYGLR